MSLDNTNVFNKISAQYYQLTTAEKKVADYVIAFQRDTQFMSISDLAEACGVAEATVSRFCRRLNYKSYNAFKLAVASATALRPGEPALAGEISAEDSVPELCQKLYNSNLDALAQSMALIRPENILAAGEILRQSDRVLCMGQGGSMIMAMEASHLFSTAFPNFIPVYDSHLQTISAATLTQRDAVLFFSYSGSTRELMDILTVVREQKARIILVTHFPKSPAASFADVILQCGANEGPLQLGSVPARLAQLFVVDVLFAEVCRRSEGCQQARERVAAALAAKHI